ncbi:MAG: Intermediate filament protein [Trizodia sp. TS-e1964]|nr:MAG: Intermediate filament protein [Trizodia sp. TS-e1964]
MALTRSHAVLLAIAAFVWWGLVVQWLPFLRYMGWGFAAGVLLTLLSLASLTLTTSRGLQYANRHAARPISRLAFTHPGVWRAELALLKAPGLQQARAPLFPSSLLISSRLDGLLHLVLRDFIASWFSNISRSSAFPDQVEGSIRAALGRVIERIVDVDIVEQVVSRILPIITDHLKHFYEAERLVRGKQLNRNITESDELDLAIAAKYRDGKLHPAASLAFSDIRPLQQEHLRRLTERFLPHLLPPPDSRSRCVGALIKEVVACALLHPLLLLLTEPDTWNQWIEAYGRSMLQDRKTVRKLREALDRHASPSPKSRQIFQTPKLAPHDSERKFERFIRAIRTCSNLSDARRFRSEVSSQLKREARADGQESLFLRRLETGKKMLDQRVAFLAAGAAANGVKADTGLSDAHSHSRLENVSLKELLCDTSGLSYFMEYMDRQARMSLVQFWIVVEGLRDPLEDETGDEPDLQATLPPWSEPDRADLAQINEAYLSKPELNIPEKSRILVRQFLAAGRMASTTQYHEARTAVLRSQTAVLNTMNANFFPKFKTSDLYFKYLTSDEASSRDHPHMSHSAPHFSDAHSTQGQEHAVLLNIPQQPARGNKGLPTHQRTVLSSNDLKSLQATENYAAFHAAAANIATSLFDDENDEKVVACSIQSNDTDLEFVARHMLPDNHIVEAMEAALNNIMEEAPDMGLHDSKPSLFEVPAPSVSNDSKRSSLDAIRSELFGMKEQKDKKPSIASLGLVNTSSRIGVFTDDDLFPDEDKSIQDEHEDPEEDKDTAAVEEQIHEAAPGDLGLAEAISGLTADIERLVAQDSVVDSLTRKAELTNNTAELRILRKSKTSLQHEMRKKELQRQQYIVQESDNSLYGRATASIKTTLVDAGEDGKEFALYVIEVRRKAGEQMVAPSWVITRRYSEFHDLNQKLRTKYASVRHLDFPRRRVVMHLQRDFIMKRREALEKYLKELLLLPDVCRSRELRAFLSQQAIASPDGNTDASAERKDMISRFYASITEGVEEILGNIPVLDHISVAGQHLISAATSQLSTSQISMSEDPSETEMAEAELNAFENKELEPFVKPICDVFLEMFELNRGNNWLRGRAVVIVLHQLLGGTIERKVRETFRAFLQEDSIIKYIAQLKENVWPGGKARQQQAARTKNEKFKSRTEASLTLATLLPDIAAGVVGKANSQAASRRIFATINNPRLNAHLALSILDETVDILFGDIRERD